MWKKIWLLLLLVFYGMTVFGSKDQGDNSKLKAYLVPTERIDCDNPAIIKKAEELLKGISSETEKVRILFEFVRDMEENPNVPCGDDLKASNVLACGVNGCYGRSVLLAALCRSAGIPARLHLQKVIIKDGKVSEKGKSDLQFGHLLTGVYINGIWRIYETVGNNKKWKKWMGDYPTAGDATVLFKADSDCLFTPNDKILMEMIPKSFIGFDQTLKDEIIKIDGGVYL
jgi:transglutaminase-like putative cysteine protease